MATPPRPFVPDFVDADCMSHFWLTHRSSSPLHSPLHKPSCMEYCPPCEIAGSHVDGIYASARVLAFALKSMPNMDGPYVWIVSLNGSGHAAYSPWLWNLIAMSCSVLKFQMSGMYNIVLSCEVLPQ